MTNPTDTNQASEVRTIYCMACESDVQARLTDGAERYPHRPDLASLPFWTHDACKTWVGCHHKTKQPTRPLGVLATPEMFEARKAIHALIDPIWQSGDYARGQIYAKLKKELGYQYHTGELRTMEEARKVWKIAADLNNQWKYDPEVKL